MWKSVLEFVGSFIFLGGSCVEKGNRIQHFGDVYLDTSKIGQFGDGLGVFANRDFKKGEIVIQWNLIALSEKEYSQLPKYEKDNFCHQRQGIQWLYPEPERHVNRCKHPNVAPNFEKQADIALYDIQKGDELTIDAAAIEDF